MIGWAGTEPALREAIFGGQATLFHTPWPNWATGFFYEEGLYNFYNDKRHSGGRFFLRKRLLESSSFIVDDPVFYEFYYGLGNEFWPGDDGRPVNSTSGPSGPATARTRSSPTGTRSRASSSTSPPSTATPSWVELDYARVVGQYGLVRKVPESWGILPNSRFAFRAYGG